MESFGAFDRAQLGERSMRVADWEKKAAAIRLELEQLSNQATADAVR
jgi:hypothetical protein